MAVFVHSIVIICLKFLSVDRFGPTATLTEINNAIWLWKGVAKSRGFVGRVGCVGPVGLWVYYVGL